MSSGDVGRVATDQVKIIKPVPNSWNLSQQASNAHARFHQASVIKGPMQASFQAAKDCNYGTDINITAIVLKGLFMLWQPRSDQSCTKLQHQDS